MPLDAFVERAVARAYRNGHTDLHLKTIPEIREYYRKRSNYFKLPAFIAHHEDHWAGDVQIRIHRLKKKSKETPLVIYLRANGHVFGNIDETDFFCHFLSAYLECPVATIEPRHSPEYKFPVPFQDCVDGIEYLYNLRSELGIAANKIGIWGECSGGNLTAGLCQVLKEGKRSFFAQQILFYPTVSHCQRYPSQDLFGQGYLMDNRLRKLLLECYIRDEKDYEDIRISPVLADQFEHVPPTLLIGAQYDPMRDENTHYLELLAKNGVCIDGSLFMPGLTHGFLWYTRKLPAAYFAQRYAAAHLKKALEEI